MKKKAFFVLIFALALIALPFATPTRGSAQGGSVCGVFMQNPAGNYLDFGIFNERVAQTIIKLNTYPEVFGRPFDPSAYIVLYDPQWSGIPDDGLLGFSSYAFVNNCYDAIPIDQPQPPTAQPEMAFYADPAQISLGSCATLFWGANEAYSQVFLSADDNSDPGGYNGPAPQSGNTAVCPAANTLYRFSAIRDGTVDSLDVVITVVWPTNPPPPTAIPTQPPQPTAIVLPTDPPAPAQPAPADSSPTTQEIELSITPINQRVSGNPIKVSSPDGTLIDDNGEYDCLVASVAMALDYFKNQGILASDEAPVFRTLVPIMRKITDPGTGLSTQDLMIDHPILPVVTKNKLTAHYVTVDTDKAYAFLQAELAAGRPVLGVAEYMTNLAQGAAGKGHAILITGVKDGKIIYNDPYGGRRWEMTTEKFTAAGAVFGYFTFTSME
jgi:hypothetical protein